MNKLVITLTFLFLVACGGGGDGDGDKQTNSSPTPSNPETVTPNPVNDDEPTDTDTDTGAIDNNQTFSSPSIVLKTHNIQVDSSQGQHQVTLGKEDAQKKVFYKVVTNSGDSEYQEYYNQQLTVGGEDAVFYKECVDKNECGETKKVFFNGDKYTLDHQVESVDDNYQSVKETLENLNDARREYDEVTAEVKDIESKVLNVETENL